MRRILLAVTLAGVMALNMGGCVQRKSPAPTPRDGDAERGKTLFTNSGCSSCHSTGEDTIIGPGLKGVTGKETLPNGKPMSTENLKEWIRDGSIAHGHEGDTIGIMPGNPQLTDKDLADLAEFLKTLR